MKKFSITLFVLACLGFLATFFWATHKEIQHAQECQELIILQ